MTMRCLIIDDEPLARKGLREYLADVGFLELAGEFDNPMKAMDALLNQRIDLIFLDIQMPRMTGLEFLRSMEQRPMIILTTAYPQYAVEGFELNAVDYLLKPFSFDRFWKAVLKARNLAGGMAAVRVDEEADYFYIKSDNNLVKIRYDSILFAEALQNYVAIQTTDRKHITYLTFKSVEEHLPSSRFIRTHKSYLVSIQKVERIEGNEIVIGPFRIPISRSEKEVVLEKLVQNKLLKR